MENNKRLYLSRKDKMRSGVCGGIAEYFSVDPTIVRLGFALFTLLNGGGSYSLYSNGCNYPK